MYVQHNPCCHVIFVNVSVVFMWLSDWHTFSNKKLSYCRGIVSCYTTVWKNAVLCLAMSAKALGLWMHVRRPSHSFVQSSSHYISRTAGTFFDKSDREYSLAPTDDLIIFWRSRSQEAIEVKSCGQSYIFVQVCGGICIYVDAEASKSHLLVKSSFHWVNNLEGHSRSLQRALFDRP